MIRLAVLIAVVVVLADQASKWLIESQVMVPPRVIEVLPVFNLVLVYNEGISFGLFGGASEWKSYALAGLAVVVSAGLFIWLARHPSRDIAIAVGLIVGGAIGNAIDRLSRGAVVDFLDFYLGEYHWPAFNLADTAITLGVAVILISDILLGHSRRDGMRPLDGGNKER